LLPPQYYYKKHAMKTKIPFAVALIISVLILNPLWADESIISGHTDFLSFQNEINPDISDLRIFPNPVRNFKFKVTSEKEIKSIQVSNILGQPTEVELQERSGKYFDVVMKEKKQGIYLIIVFFEDNSKEVKRIIVNQE